MPARGTASNRQTALGRLLAVNRMAASGRLYVEGGGGSVSISGFYLTDGVTVAPVYDTITAPVSGDFAWVNQGGASVATSGGAERFTLPASASLAFRGRVKSAPATPYTITAIISNSYVATDFVDSFGLCFRQSGDGKLHTFGVGFATAFTGGHYILSAKWTSPTVFSANYAANSFYATNPIFLRIADDGANRICSYSSDGINFLTYDTIGRTDFLTADQVGFGASVQNASYGGILTMFSWTQA